MLSPDILDESIVTCIMTITVNDHVLFVHQVVPHEARADQMWMKSLLKGMQAEMAGVIAASIRPRFTRRDTHLGKTRDAELHVNGELLTTVHYMGSPPVFAKDLNEWQKWQLADFIVKRVEPMVEWLPGRPSANQSGSGTTEEPQPVFGANLTVRASN